MANTTVRKLADHWGQPLSSHRGASPAAIREFELSYGVKLPADMRDYFLQFDGTGAHSPLDQDAKGFSFWQLAQVRPVKDELMARRIPPMEGMEQFFVFADFLTWLWAYAIRLDAGTSARNPIVLIDGEKSVPIADSFSEFVDLYVQNSESLYQS